jgi:hypothetical protein
MNPYTQYKSCSPRLQLSNDTEIIEIGFNHQELSQNTKV